MSIISLAKELTNKGDVFLAQNGPDKFHEEAAKLLTNSSMVEKFDSEEVVKFLFDEANIDQNFKNLEFSDLPLTIARGKNCFIDIYFWRRRPTTIHNHHFTGAFMCLAGNNVDLEFSFEKKFSIGEFHQIGELKLLHERNIVPGDIAPINFLDNFIHQNHHQADLSVNLCFRTAEKEKSNLANFYYSGLRYEQDARLLTKTHQLKRLIEVVDYGFEELSLSDDEMMRFLILYGQTNSLNPKLQKFIGTLELRVFKKFGVEVSKLVNDHYTELDRLEDSYT